MQVTYHLQHQGRRKAAQAHSPESPSAYSSFAEGAGTSAAPEYAEYPT